MTLLLALCVLYARADDAPIAPAAEAPAASTPVVRERHGAVAVGGGGAWLMGGNGGGYGAGFDERLGAELNFSPMAAVGLQLAHSRHPLDDASPYFPDTTVPPEALSGTRDYLDAELGLRLSMRFVSSVNPDKIHAIPYFRFGIGGAFTDTKLEVPSFDGRQIIRSRAAAPMLGVGAGCEVQIEPWVSIVPGVSFQALLARDDGEIDKQTQVGIEVRGEGTLDVSFVY